MKKIILILPLVFLLNSGFTQDYYRTAFGLRFGSDIGVTVKHFTSNVNAVEGIVSFRWGGFLLTGLYEYEGIAFNTVGLNWYAGGGAHVGIWSKYSSNAYWWDNNKHPDNYTVMGVDLILGLEYVFGGVPINIALDWKPAFNFIGYYGFWGDFAALSIRYMIY
jgi:hypothetical protein